MQIRLVYHGQFQSLTGKNVEMLYLDESATIASLQSRLAASHPLCLPHVTTLQFSRGGRAITPDAFLADGDIIDVMMADTALA